MQSPFAPREFVDVEPGSSPPDGAPAVDAQFLNDLQDYVKFSSDHALLDELGILKCLSNDRPDEAVQWQFIFEEDTETLLYNTSSNNPPNWTPLSADPRALDPSPAGEFTNPIITVDDRGRITEAESGEEVVIPIGGEPDDGDILYFDESEGLYLPAPPPSPGGGTPPSEYLTESEGDARYVRITGDPNDGQFFKWDEASGTIVPVNAPSGGGTLPAPIPILSFYAGHQSATGWTNMPSTLTEYLGVAGAARATVNLTNATEVRLLVRQVAAAAAGAKLLVRYTTDLTDAATAAGGTWASLGTNSNTPSLALESAAAGGVLLRAGAWQQIAAGAKGNVQIAICGLDGDGVADPSFRAYEVQVR